MRWVFAVLAFLAAMAWLYHRLTWWQAALAYVLVSVAAIAVEQLLWRPLRQSWDDLSTRRYKGGG